MQSYSKSPILKFSLPLGNHFKSKLMSKQKSTKKQVVVTTGSARTNKKTESTYRSKRSPERESELPFSKNNLLWMAGGFVVMLLGMALMIGGHMPSPDVWEPERIYGFRQTVLSPIVILAGIGIIIYGIFKQK